MRYAICVSLRRNARGMLRILDNMSECWVGDCLPVLFVQTKVSTSSYSTTTRKPLDRSHELHTNAPFPSMLPQTQFKYLKSCTLFNFTCELLTCCSVLLVWVGGSHFSCFYHHYHGLRRAFTQTATHTIKLQSNCFLNRYLVRVTSIPSHTRCPTCSATTLVVDGRCTINACFNVCCRSQLRSLRNLRCYKSSCSGYSTNCCLHS